MNLSSTFTRLLAVATPLLFTGFAVAQDPAAAPAEQPRGALADMFAYENAGLVGWIIVVMSVVSLALIIENFVSIKREKLAPPELIDELGALFDEENFQDAVELCENEKVYLTRCVGAGLSKLGHPFETIQATIREMETEESTKLFQKVGWLSLMAATAPMMGLFGTVTGMFVTFGTIASAGGSVGVASSFPGGDGLRGGGWSASTRRARRPAVRKAARTRRAI
jgi:biopolymer transport protein ExbB